MNVSSGQELDIGAACCVQLILEKGKKKKKERKIIFLLRVLTFRGCFFEAVKQG